MSNSDTTKNNGLKLVMTIALVLLVVIFALQNSAETMIKFWFWEGYLPLVILLLLCFAIGLITALISMWPISRNSRKESDRNQQLEKQISDLKAETAKLKSSIESKDTPKF
jgi:uncharacterized integral membrane protein